jgi:hypothetical protein
VTQPFTGNLAAAEVGFLNAGIPAVLVTELLEAYSEAKRRFHLGDLRPNIVEGGRFSEAVFRILQWATDSGNFTPLGQALPGVPNLLNTLAQRTGHDDSLRLHIPRVLQGIYQIRNTRNGPHLGPINVNQMDATLVVHDMDWVLAELVRLYHNISANDAQALVDDLVAKEVPAIQVFGSYPKLLRNVTLPEHLLILLYWRGEKGATRQELSTWTAKAVTRIPTAREKANLSTTLRRLDEKGEVHIDGDNVYIAIPGQHRVENKNLIEPA